MTASDGPPPDTATKTSSRADLSIGELASRTGVSAPTLRMWEARHGFPRPIRLDSGHRRYPESEAQLVDAVLAGRRRGLSLSAAIGDALAASVREPGAMFANLRRRIGNRSQRLTKPALVALSRAIEDEYLASGEGGLLVGSFQRPAFYRAAARRWGELGRLAEVSIVFASFRSARHPRRAPAEIPISSRDSLIREWGVICDAPGFAACLAGTEIAQDQPVGNGSRSFEVVWSFDPIAVREASESAISIAAANAPGIAESARKAIGQAPSSAAPDAAIATADRMIAGLASQLAVR